MAEILDVLRITQERFTAFAEEWLEIPEYFYVNGVIRFGYEHYILGLLVDESVFTEEELRTELTSRRIYLGDDVYAKAFKK